MSKFSNMRRILLGRAKAQLFINTTSFIILVLITFPVLNYSPNYKREWIGLCLFFGLFPIWNISGILMDLLSGQVKIVQGILVHKSTFRRGSYSASLGIYLNQLCLINESEKLEVELISPASEMNLLEIGSEYKIYVSRYSNIYLKSVRRITAENE